MPVFYHANLTLTFHESYINLTIREGRRDLQDTNCFALLPE